MFSAVLELIVGSALITLFAYLLTRNGARLLKALGILVGMFKSLWHKDIRKKKPIVNEKNTALSDDQPTESLILEVGKAVLALFFGLNLIIGALIPGTTTVQVYLPKGIPRLAENLGVYMAPVRIDGKDDVDRGVSKKQFDGTGRASELIKFNWLENTLHVRVWDATRPDPPLYEDYVYVSPFVRRGLWNKRLHPNGQWAMIVELLWR